MADPSIPLQAKVNLRRACEALLYPEGALDVSRLPDNLKPKVEAQLGMRIEEADQRSLLDTLVALASTHEQFFQSLQFAMTRVKIGVGEFYEGFDTYFGQQRVAERAAVPRDDGAERMMHSLARGEVQGGAVPLLTQALARRLGRPSAPGGVESGGGNDRGGANR